MEETLTQLNIDFLYREMIFVMGKMYVTDVPEWAQAILPDTED